MLRRGLHRVSGSDVEQSRRELADAGWRVFVLPEGISDRTTFFLGVRAVLPLDPPLVGNDHWDALSDSLWSGLHDLADKRIAIIWPAALMASRNAESFEIATRVLADVSEALADPEATVGNVKELSVVIA